VELRRDRVDLADILHSAVETSKPSIDRARHQLSVSLPAEPLILEADGIRLIQVVGNLLNNAAKYTDEGGHIWLTAHREGGQAVVSVRDTGIGIPADMLAQIFEMFTQVHRSVGRAEGGLGIGLTMGRSLVEMHGGTIDAHSEGPGRGSEFIVRLPLLADLPEPKAGTAPGEGTPVSLARQRILVVDDNRDAADSLALLLAVAGADTQVAYDGAAALAALDSYQPQAALIDIGMPGMDGHALAQQIRRQPACAGITLIALTGWGQEADRARSRRSGFDHHLTKPVDVEALTALLAMR
jgi:CheY-like chemotaxis protein